jgi:hypothetical protein
MTMKSILTATVAALACPPPFRPPMPRRRIHIDSLAAGPRAPSRNFQNGGYNVQYGNRRVVVGNGSSDGQVLRSRGYSVCVAMMTTTMMTMTIDR